MPHVARLAPRTIVLNRGLTHFLGDTPAAINAYYALFSLDESEREHVGSGEARVERIRFINEFGHETDRFEYGRPVRIVLEIVAKEMLDDVLLNVVFRNAGSEVVAECNNFVRAIPVSIGRGERVSLELRLDAMLLNPGLYHVGTILAYSEMLRHIDWVIRATSMTVFGGRPASAPVQFMADWRLERRGVYMHDLRKCG
jgi:hypothetical protein